MTVRKRWRWERDQQVCCSTERCTACLTLLFCLSEPLPLPVAGWRDRRRRLAEAIFTLATNAMIGNQKAVPKLKMVLRLMSKFMHESGAACALPQPDASGKPRPSPRAVTPT